MANRQVAALIAAFADLAVGGGRAGHAVGESLGDVRGVGLEHPFGAPHPAGGKQGVEVGVAEVADGLAVQVQAAGDLGDRYSDIHRLLRKCGSNRPKTPEPHAQLMPSSDRLRHEIVDSARNSPTPAVTIPQGDADR